MLLAFNNSMKKSRLTLILIVAIFMVSIFYFEASADTASGSVGAGYNQPCTMPGQCQSGKCLSYKCGCKYDRECGTGKTCTVATGICSLTAINYPCTANSQCQSGFCGSVTEFGRLCERCRTTANCGTGKTCNTATGQCRTATSRAAYGAACAQNSECASNVCRQTTMGLSCGCSATVGCGAGEYCGSESTCRLGSPPSALNILRDEINALIRDMQARAGRL